jgi:hypothetical protein
MTDRVADYVDNYEFRGDDGDYAPNDSERVLLEDALNGFVVDHAPSWRPIEGAPTDGTDVIVFVEKSGEQFVAYYDAGSWVYALIPLAKGGGSLCCEATHWMPLPEPPTGASQ